MITKEKALDQVSPESMEINSWDIAQEIWEAAVNMHKGSGERVLMINGKKGVRFLYGDEANLSENKKKQEPKKPEPKKETTLKPGVFYPIVRGH